MQLNHRDTMERLARIERMMVQYRFARKRHLRRRAIKLWRRAQTQQHLRDLDTPPPSVH